MNISCLLNPEASVVELSRARARMTESHFVAFLGLARARTRSGRIKSPTRARARVAPTASATPLGRTRAYWSDCVSGSHHRRGVARGGGKDDPAVDPLRDMLGQRGLAGPGETEQPEDLRVAVAQPPADLVEGVGLAEGSMGWQLGGKRA